MRDANQLFDLSGKVALVTGGSRGMGKEMILAFAKCGADVVIASRKQGSCEELAEQVRKETGRRALAVACNVSDWSQNEQLADTALAHYGRVDVLVNNAGMSPLYEHVADVSEALWDKVIGVNMKGPFRLTAKLGKHMVERGSGSIIFVSSTGSLHPSGGIIPYAGAKAAVNAMTVGFAQHFGPSVRVNCIIPGPFLTDISKAWDMPSFEARAKRDIFLKRGGQAEEIVGAALYFASDASSFTTGAHLVVSGGGIG
jgi:NAD(P)-dependent dehydrogenase (short-subunit alcohol dehydrogenase family)